MKLRLRRITLAAALALVPVLAFGADDAAAKERFGDWLHDEMQHRGLWLYGSPNLAIERAPANLPPRTPGKRWLLSRDAATGAVVYFVPGDIRTVEIDSHRKVGTTADLVLSVSPDGKNWLPLNATAATMEVAADWEYRLLAAADVPAGLTHLRIEFPAGTKPPALRLTEVWIRFDWENGFIDEESGAKPVSAPAVPAPTAVAAKPAEPIITYAEPKAVATKSAETATDRSLVPVATKSQSEEAPKATPAAESDVHSLALVAPPTKDEPVVVHEAPPASASVAAELPREVPAAPVSTIEIAEVPGSTNPVAVLVPAVAPAAAPSAADVTVAPALSPESRVVEEAAAPVVSSKPAKKAAKKSAATRVRRGPRSK